MDDLFIELVRDMRAAQKLYFKQRTKSTLLEAKRLEGDVDAYLIKNQREYGAEIQLHLPDGSAP